MSDISQVQQLNGVAARQNNLISRQRLDSINTSEAYSYRIEDDLDALLNDDLEVRFRNLESYFNSHFSRWKSLDTILPNDFMLYTGAVLKKTVAAFRLSRGPGIVDEEELEFELDVADWKVQQVYFASLILPDPAHREVLRKLPQLPNDEDYDGTKLAWLMKTSSEELLAIVEGLHKLLTVYTSAGETTFHDEFSLDHAEMIQDCIAELQLRSGLDWTVIDAQTCAAQELACNIVGKPLLE
ncbi:hypothetical protein LTS18_007778 [Coniosporium uncinatum]|uniref:Uncharacterized protein n=1 Tax=Coniosporium uncinatum TaxID=93489 RepID=A0ACC3D2R0_9PEZI|nr:hypothetical protein LTS18_007778 [Coniosporium uncinatum]